MTDDPYKNAMDLARLKHRFRDTLTPEEAVLWDDWHARMVSRGACLQSIQFALERMRERDEKGVAA